MRWPCKLSPAPGGAGLVTYHLFLITPLALFPCPLAAQPHNEGTYFDEAPGTIVIN